MLVLSRKVDQPICIGDNIEVRVLEIRGNRVRLGISAPAHVSVKRQESLGHGSLNSENLTPIEIPSLAVSGPLAEELVHG